ncbi:restriction endonuclease subunit S [Desulfobulbus sp.]|uniref:restriction endonuclease subunit S n=1 Tax=Desulfobulbus sp. TaxID=895 RepID=UPI0027B8D641|nr:restriction endonuclease subunit S [Desulfobulbus sp.]
MDAQQFLADFGHIANAPGGVARLREMILSLAFKGVLCPHSFESSEDLLEDIERQRQIFGGETRKQRITRQDSATTDTLIPHDIPAHWVWVGLSAVGHTWGQKKPTKSFAYIDVSSIDNKAGTLRQSPEVISASTAPSRARKIVQKGTLIYSTVRPYLLNIAIIERDFDYEPIASTAFAIIHPWEGISARYLYYYLRSPVFVSYVESVQIGMAYPAINDEKFYSGVVPLPPTEEQTRIVAKVDELMALCDKLETQQQQRRRLQNNLRQSTLQAVAAAANPQELHTAWSRLTGNFGQLFHAPEDARALRDVIFDLAMRGMFLPTTKLSSPVTEDDLAPLPTGWKWKTLGELSEYITSGSRGWKGYLSTSGDAFIRSQDIKQDALIFENPAFVALPEKAEGKRTLVRGGDLLLTITGGNVGKCAFVPILKCNAYVSQHVALIRLHDSSWAEFIHFWMINANGGRNFLSRYIYGDKPGLNLAQVASVPIPIPPKTEKTKILESLRQFQVICNRLAELLDRGSNFSKILVKAAVSSITGIATEQKENVPVKVPQTELIAPLRLGQAPDIKAQAPLATILARHNGEISAKDLYQRFGGEIDAFYAQLKTEVSHGWILEPEVAEMREKFIDRASA